MDGRDEVPSDFAALMLLKECSRTHYISLRRPFKPTVARGVFGGHLLAQSLYAASKTIPNGFICNNMQAQFLTGNTDSVPFHYLIENVRDGARYLVRQVRTYQDIPVDNEPNSTTKRAFVFLATVSFKQQENVDEPVVTMRAEIDASSSRWNHQPPKPILDTNAEICDPAPDVDIPSWIEWSADKRNGHVQVEHAIDVRKVPPSFSSTDVLANRKMYHFYRSVASLGDDPNLHLAHIYTSDRNSLFIAAHILEKSDQIGKLYCVFSTRWTGDGRILYVGRLFDNEGSMLAEFLQDGMGLFDSRL